MSQQEQIQKIKELRNRTQAGILDCKKALEATHYDLEKAITWLKEQGIAKAAKKGGAIAAEGIVAIKENDQVIVMYEINSQTDFVATNENFQKLVNEIGDILLSKEFTTIELALSLTNKENVSINDLISQTIAIVGEKIVLRRALRIEKMKEEVIGAYVHNNHRVASIVVLVGGNNEIARQVAMHVASMNPEYLDSLSIPEAKLADLKGEIYSSPMLENKPDNIRDNIAQGMLNKKLAEITLIDQEFIMEKMKVKDFLTKHHAKAISMFRYEVAEGIDKKTEDFASEVAAQMGSIDED